MARKNWDGSITDFDDLNKDINVRKDLRNGDSLFLIKAVFDHILTIVLRHCREEFM